MTFPRFSVRRLFLLTALVAAACYWLFAMPTTTARRFARAVERGDYHAANRMTWPKCQNYTIPMAFGFLGPAGTESSIEQRTFAAKLEPLTWNDIIHRERRIVLHVDDDSNVLNGAFGFSAGPIVLKLLANPYRIDYHSKSLTPNPRPF